MMDLHIEEETYMKYYIGIDLGGTNIVAGVVNESYEILAKASVKTNLPRPKKSLRIWQRFRRKLRKRLA